MPRPPATETPHRRRRRPPTPLYAVAAVAAASWGLLRLAPPAWVDGPWAHTVLPALTAAARPWLATLPGSLSAATLVVGLVVVLAVGARQGWPGRFALLLAAVAVGGATFDVAWGVGYRRTPLEARLGLPEGPPTAADLAVALDLAIAVATEAAPGDAATVDRGAPWPSGSWAAAADCVAAADALVSERRSSLALPGTVRRLPAGVLLAGGFAGFVGPWWREPHLDGALPPAAARATALHELAHAAGWAREAETDALGVLAGLRCDDRDLRFAAAVHALGLLRTEWLRTTGAAPDGELQARLAALPDAHARPAVRRAAGATYDAYLRAHGVDAGLADYGRAGVLVAAALAHCERNEAALPCPATTAP